MDGEKAEEKMKMRRGKENGGRKRGERVKGIMNSCKKIKKEEKEERE